MSWNLVVSKRELKRKKNKQKNKLLAVLYGGGKPSESLQVSLKEFVKLATSKGSYQPGKLEILSKKIPCMIKDIQCHPVTGIPMHVDFLNLKYAEKFNMFISLDIIGTSVGVKRGGVLNVAVPELEVIAKSSAINSIPRSMQIDISSMRIGDVYHLSDLTLPQGVQAANPARDNTILSVVAPSGMITENEEKPDAES